MDNKETIPEIRALTVELPEDLLKRMKIAAVEHDTTLKAIVEEAIRRELARSEKAA